MQLGEEYKPLIIKEYEYWTLVLHEKQGPFVGKCYAWWKDRESREGEGMTVSALPPDAKLEVLDDIHDDVMDAWRALGYKTGLYGRSFLLNMSYLANTVSHNHHMHWHFVPRTTKSFLVKRAGVTVVDPCWGRHYRLHGVDYPLPDAQTLAIRLIMAEVIGGIV